MPSRDRLATIAARIDDGVDEAWRVARRGAQLVEARRAIDADDARQALDALAVGAEPPGPDSPEARTIEALRAQLATASRLDGVIADAQSRLRLLDARLDESVARVIELSVQVGAADELGDLGADVDGLVSELESLRLALEETERADDRATGAA